MVLPIRRSENGDGDNSPKLFVLGNGKSSRGWAYINVFVRNFKKLEEKIDELKMDETLLQAIPMDFYFLSFWPKSALTKLE